MKNTNFILFADCIPVKGFNRSIICDTKNNQYFFIPNGLYDILQKYNGQTIETIKMDYEYKYDEIIDEYFSFLFENRLIFFTPQPELFPKINMEWSSPSKITNLIIDHDTENHDFNDLILQCETLKCSYLQLRFYNPTSLDTINNLVNNINKNKSRIISVDFIIPYNKDTKDEEFYTLLEENSRIHSIIVYNSPKNKSHSPLNNNMGYLLEVERNILNEKHCGIINAEYFYSNINLLSESLSHNTCLNRKISVDKEGYIRNCPSMSQHFGNIKNTSLEEALNHPDFKKYWNVTKDTINTCKDCEFRHICTDCRAYTERNNFNQGLDLSKPLKCGYNPYNNEWEEWSKNPLKQKSIKHYNMQEIINSYA